MHQCNDSVYGLAAAVFTADAERADRVCGALRVGIVWKNCCQPAFVQAPWGGKSAFHHRKLGRSIIWISLSNSNFTFRREAERVR